MPRRALHIGRGDCVQPPHIRRIPVGREALSDHALDRARGPDACLEARSEGTQQYVFRACELAGARGLAASLRNFVEVARKPSIVRSVGKLAATDHDPARRPRQ